MQSLPPIGKLRGVSTYLPVLEALCLEHIQNMCSATTISAWDWGLQVARHTFLWVLLTHRNFTKDLGTLEKSLWTVWRSCRWLGLHPLPSLLFYRFMYKYKANPLPNNHLFYILHHSQTENISKHIMFWFVPLKLTLTRSVHFITPIFRLDSFTLSWTKILS